MSKHTVYNEDRSVTTVIVITNTKTNKTNAPQKIKILNGISSRLMQDSATFS